MSDRPEPSSPAPVPAAGGPLTWLRAKWPEVMFFTSVAGMSMLFGFGTTLALARRNDPEHFGRGLTPSGSAGRAFESGASLAARALARATLYSVGGVGLFCLGVWKLSGAGDFQEFRQKMGSVLPRVPRSETPTSRTEFDSISELFRYLQDQDDRLKGRKPASPQSETEGPNN